MRRRDSNPRHSGYEPELEPTPVHPAIESGVPYGIRTRVLALKGQYPKPLDERNVKILRGD
jgi:hypothetical protein